MNNQINPLMAEILNCHLRKPVSFKPFQLVWSSGEKLTYHLILKDENNPKSSEYTTTEKDRSELNAELEKFGSSRYEFCDTCGYYTENARDDQGTECDECKYVRRHGHSSDYRI